MEHSRAILDGAEVDWLLPARWSAITSLKGSFRPSFRTLSLAQVPTCQRNHVLVLVLPLEVTATNHKRPGLIIDQSEARTILGACAQSWDGPISDRGQWGS